MRIIQFIIGFLILVTISCNVDSTGSLHHSSFEEEQGLKDLLDSSASLIRKEKYNGAILVLDSALKLAINVANDSLLAITHNNTGSLDYWLGNYSRSIRHYERALLLDRESGDSSGMAIRLKNLGLCYSKKGEFETSVDNYLESLSIVRFTNQKSEEASLNNSLGNVLNQLELFKRGLEHLVEAETIWRGLGDSLRVSFALGNQGNSFLGLGEFDKAISSHEQALEIKEHVASKSSISISLNNIGEVYFKLGRYDLAQNYFLRSLELRSQKGEVKGVAIVLHNLASIAIQQKRFKETIKYLRRADEIAHSESLKDIRVENLRLQKMMYAKMGEFQKAFEVDSEYDELKEIAFSTQVVKVQELELEQEENYKEAYKSQFELSEVRRGRQAFQSRVQQVIIIAAILAIIIVGYFAYTLRQKNRHIENLIRELHHRVKNHLGMISGMFGAQTDLSIADTAVLDEAKTRVEAVNGIHRRLYRQDEYEYVNMKEYLEELVDNNALVFGLFNRIEKHFEIHEQIMDIDKAISVGLIANEVLTNAFKYGLQDTQKPMLKIVLEKALKGYKMVIFNNAETDKSAGGGFGGELINRLALNLKGQIQIIKEGGFQFELTFP